MSTFQLYHKHQYTRCDQSQYVQNKTYASSHSGIVQCQDEEHTVKVSETSCAVKYTTNQCDTMNKEYKDYQVYYHHLIQLCKIDPSYQQPNVSQTLYYDYTILSDIKKHLQTKIQPLAVYASYTSEQKCTFWLACISCIQNISAEKEGRNVYFTTCMCIDDRAHIQRLLLLEELLQAVYGLFSKVFQAAKTHYAFAISLAESSSTVSYFYNKYFEPNDVLTLYAVTRNCKENDDRLCTTFIQTIRYLAKGCLSDQVSKFISRHGVSYPMTNGDMIKCQRILGTLYTHFGTILKQLFGTLFFEVIKKKLQIFEDYYQKGIQCVTLDPQTKDPTSLQISYEKLREYLADYHLNISLNDLTRFINKDEVRITIFKQCLKTYFQTNLEELFGLCEKVKSSQELKEDDYELVQAMMEICSEYNPSKGVQYYLYTNSNSSTKLHMTWQKLVQIGKQRLANGDTPTGHLTKDLPKMTIMNKISLLREYLHPSQNRSEYDSEEEEESYEPDTKRRKYATYTL